MNEGLHDHEDIDETFEGVFEGVIEDDEALNDERHRIRRQQRDFVPFFDPTTRMGIFPGMLQPTGPGVQTATLQTPRGSATVRLPEPVVTERAFKEAIQKLETTLNGISKDAIANRAAIASAQAANARTHSQLSVRHRKLAMATKAGLDKMRRQQQMTLLLTAAAAALVQRENAKLFDAHVHTAGGPVPTTLSNQNLTFLLLVPMLPGLMSGGDLFGLKLGGSDMTNLLLAGGLAFLILRDGSGTTKTA
ncbi:MAG: hypothetical protein ACRDGM_12275 [bacterium]